MSAYKYYKTKNIDTAIFLYELLVMIEDDDECIFQLEDGSVIHSFYLDQLILYK